MSLALQARASSSAASRTSCCPTRCRSSPRADAPAGRPVGPRGRPRDRAAEPPRWTRRSRSSPAPSGPVIVVGHGARFDMRRRRRARRARSHAPVLTTFKAKGLVSDDHPLGCGVLGRSGTPVASWLMNESDLLLVFGASFSNHTGHRVVQADRAGRLRPDGARPLPPGRRCRCSATSASPRAVLRRARSPTERATAIDQRADVAERWAIWRAEKARRAPTTAGTASASAAVFAALTRHVPDDAVIAVDVGNNTYSFGRYFECSAASRC